MKILEGFIPRNLTTRKARTLMTALGIALGVAAIIATGVVQDSITRSTADLFNQAAGRADLVVTDAMTGLVGGEGFDTAILQQVWALDGVDKAAPLLQVVTLPTSQMDDWEYSFVFGIFNGMLVYGVDPKASRDFGHYSLVAGEDLTEDDTILLTERYAKDLGMGLGDTVELAAAADQVRLEVVGLIASDGLARLNLGQVGLTTRPTAERIFGISGRLNQIDVVAAPGVDVDVLKAQLQATLGRGFRVARPASKGELVNQMYQFILTGTGFIGTLALLVGGFLIYNTFATTVVERTRELGLLRALGAGRGQIVGLVLTEAALLGLVGAVVGVFFGLGLASAMCQMTGATFNTNLTRLTVSPRHVISGLGLGVVLALVSALIPALRASRLAVVEAIQSRRQGNGGTARWQVITGLVVATFGLATIIGYETLLENAPFELAWLAMCALLIGVGLLIPAVIPTLERFAGAILGRLGVEGQLGGRNLARRPGRAALTAGALMVGLVSVITIGGVGTNLEEIAIDYVDRTLAAELWVYAPQRLPFDLAVQIETLPGVEFARPAATIPTRLMPPDPAQSGATVIYTALDPQRSKHLDFYFASDGGDREQALARLEAGGAVLLASPLREWYGLDLGDTVRLQTLQGPVDFEIAGVTFNLTASGYGVLGTWSDAIRYFNVDGCDIFALDLSAEADPTAVRERILETWGDQYNLKIETMADFQTRTRQLARNYQSLNQAMILVGVFVAVLGVVNTLLMNILERRREIGVLRSLGMTHGQIIRLILSESVAMGIMGGALGLVLGIGLSRFAVSSASAFGYDLSYVFPWRDVRMGILIALILPPLAGLWPAWRGARVNIVEAMRSE